MLIVHGTLITESREARIIHDGAMRIEGTRIVDLGTSSDLCVKYPEEERLDAQGMLVMSGMICAHTHCQGILARGTAPAHSGMADMSRRLETSLGYQDIRYATLLSCIEAIRCGTTTFFDHHTSPGVIRYSLDAAAEAVVQAGLRACLSYVVTDRDGMTKARQGIQENARFARRARETPLLAASMGLEAPAVLSDDTLTAAVGTAALSRIGFHVSLTDTRDDVRGGERRHGVRAVERLRRHGILGPRTLAVHCRRETLPEMEILRKAGAWVIYNPRSRARRSVRLAPIADFLDHGLAVCLGTDGLSANMFSEMQSAYLIHLLPSGSSRSVSVDRIAHMVLKNNATMASRVFHDHLGELGLGALADIIFVDYVGSPQVTETSLPWHCVLGLSDAHVDTTIVAGRVLMRHGYLYTVDERAVATRGRELARRLWARVARA